MATESLIFDILARDGASPSFAKVGLAADKASGSLKDMSSKLKDISGRTAQARVGLEGDKEAQVELDRLDAKLAQLGRRLASPNIRLDGVLRARAELGAVDLALDRIDGRTAEAKVKVEGTGTLARLFGGLGGGGIGGLGAAIPGLGGLLANPVSAIATVVAALAALPFAAAAAAGGIVTALGGGLAAVGVIAASKTKQVKAAFADLKADASKQLAGIGTPFNKALEDILRTTDRLLPQILAPFKDALKTIAPAFDRFGTTLVKSFGSPVVAGAVRELGKAFAAVLDALRPELPAMINKVAGGIRGIASAIHDHPQIFADFINFIVQSAGALLGMIGGLARTANWIVEFVKKLVHWTAVGTDFVRESWVATGHLVEHLWDTLVSSAQAFGHDIAHIFDTLRHTIAAVWDTIWRNTVTRARNGISDVVGWFKTLPGRAISALWGLGSHLYSFARAALGDFLRGLKSIAGAVFSWVGNFVRNIWNKVKGFFGIHSPSSLFYDIGKNLMLGLFHGIKDHAHKAQDAWGGAVGALGGPASASAQQAQAYARSRLGAYGWGAGQMAPLIMLWNQESGWNRLARNPSSGAYGIPQALPPGKMGAAANPPLSSAAAQINWGLGYIRARYGSPAGAWSHEQAFNWYGSGFHGWFDKPTIIGVGERGRERVDITPAHASRGGSHKVMLTIRSGGSRMDDVIVDIIRQAVAETGGGDVQVALGGSY